jgi:hypothetical protein
LKLKEATLKLEEFVSASSFVKIRYKIAVFAVGLTLLLCAAVISAQETPKPVDAPAMFDEYGRIGGCDHSARLDNLAISLQNDPNLKSYIVYYGPESISAPTLDIIKDYLVNSRGVAEDRFETVYAGPNSDLSEPRIQLWLAPSGAPAPELPRYESKIETFSGLFDDYAGWDGIYLEGDEDAGTGPPVPDVSFATFVDMVKNRKDTMAYLVAYSGTEVAPEAWRRVAQKELSRLQAQGVTPDRVRTIYGGRDKDSKETKIQLWILPADAPPPVADAGPEPPPQKNIYISTYGDYELGDKRGERWAFEVLLGSLRANSDLRVCIIVRFEEEKTAIEEPAEAQPETRPVIELNDLASTTDETVEFDPPDLVQVIDRWKNELAVKYKIREDRIVVLFATRRASELGGNSLETWVVPAGALLPNPDAEPTEETAEEAKPAEPVGTENDKSGVPSEKSGVPSVAGKPGRQ